jgi:hypothetical protein
MTDLITTALSRLTNQFSESPKLRGMVEAMVRPLQDALATIEQLRTERWPDTAIGVQLDGVGQIVGEPRNGRGDDEYRAAIAFRIFVNTSNATPGDLIQGLRTLTQADEIQYIEQYPATAMLFTGGPVVPVGLQETMQSLAPAAISDVQIMVSYAHAPPFRFSRQVPDNQLNVGEGTRLTANGNRIRVSPQGIEETIGPVLGGITPSFLTANGFKLAVGPGRLRVNDPNTQTLIDSGYHLAGVYS